MAGPSSSLKRVSGGPQVLIGPLLTAAALIAATATIGRPAGGPLASTSAAVAAAITILFPWPQLLRSIRLRTAAGVSGASWLMMFFAISGWALYGIEHSDRYQQISSALTLPAVCGVLCVIHRSQGISVKHAGYTMAATGLGVLTVAFGGGIGSADSRTWNISTNRLHRSIFGSVFQSPDRIFCSEPQYLFACTSCMAYACISFRQMGSGSTCRCRDCFEQFRYFLCEATDAPTEA